MIQPNELRLGLPMEIANGKTVTSTEVWNILSASKTGDLEAVKKMADACTELIYGQYNYTPPIHFAVREGHVALVNYLLNNGAHNPRYKIYPFLDNLETIAADRNFNEIAGLLKEYSNNPALQKFDGDNGEIDYKRTDQQKEFERAVDKNDLAKVKQLLNEHPEYAIDETYFWGEGILMMPAKENHREMIDLLTSHGAKVPDILKWTQGYYFERYEGAAYMMEKGMNPNVMSWQHVTILHDMAQKGNVAKAELLIQHGAALNPVEEEYQSTPLGLAARWGHIEMVNYLLQQGADPGKAGADWSTPLAWATKKGHPEIKKILMTYGAVL